MRLPAAWREALLAPLQRATSSRPPDFIIGGADNPYLLRWYLIPRNRWANLYFHLFLRSDDDRALHDHPWCSLSIVLSAGYFEHLAGRVFYRRPGAITARRAATAHRVELLPANGAERPAYSLFITGPKTREWGFHCPRGWRHWRLYSNPDDHGATVGRGCD